MMCYKDMTFCPFYLDCANQEGCSRPLTPEIRIQADLWWGKMGAPICAYTAKPDCWAEWSRL